MNILSSDSRLPLYQRFRDHLIEQIANNHWRAGAAIPPEAVLSTQYQLSTGTVRKAIEALVGEGILERQQGRGTFVRRPKFQSSLFRCFRFQGPGGECQLPQSRILSVKPVKAPLSVSEVLGLAADAPVICIVRVHVLDTGPVLAEEIWLPRERFQALLDVDLSRQGLLLYPTYEEVCGQVVACVGPLVAGAGGQPGDGDRAAGPGLRRPTPGVATRPWPRRTFPLSRGYTLSLRRVAIRL
jgi:GntR family transcriptional regulator